MKGKLLLWVVLLLVGFVAGLALQYSSQRQLERDLATVKQQMVAYQASSQLWQLRDSAALLGLELARNNYGTAAEYSTKFFDQARTLANQTSDSSLKSTLQEIVNARDRVTAGIAKQDPTVLTEIQTLVAKVHEDNKQ